MYHPNLLAHYRFESTQANLGIDASGNGNDGTVYGATQGIGQFGGGADFSVNDYIDLGNPASLRFTDEFTISLWAYPTISTSYRGIIAKGSNVPDYGIACDRSINGTNVFGRVTIGSTYFTTPSVNIGDDNWTHVCLTFSNQLLSLYIDGELGSSVNTNAGSIRQSANSVTIGKNQINEYWNGSLDEVKIFNKAYDNLIDVNLLRNGQNPR